MSDGTHPVNGGHESAPPVTADDYFAIAPETLIYDTGVSDGAVRLWLVLRRHADARDASYPSRARLAKKLRCSTDTVDRRVKELVDAGWLEVHARVDQAGDRTSNLYHLRRGSRRNAATGSRVDAATGSRTDAALTRSPLNESQLNHLVRDDSRIPDAWREISDWDFEAEETAK